MYAGFCITGPVTYGISNIVRQEREATVVAQLHQLMLVSLHSGEAERKHRKQRRKGETQGQENKA